MTRSGGNAGKSIRWWLVPAIAGFYRTNLAGGRPGSSPDASRLPVTDRLKFRMLDHSGVYHVCGIDCARGGVIRKVQHIVMDSISRYRIVATRKLITVGNVLAVSEHKFSMGDQT